MAEVKWIKITTDIFDDEKIKLIETMPEGDSIIVIWLKLLTKAGKINDGGLLYLNQNIPYTNEMLSTVFNRSLMIIKLAIKTFIEFGMVEVTDSKQLLISNWEKHQNIDGLEKIRELGRIRNVKYREKKKQLLLTNDVSVTSRDAIDKNKIRLEEEKNKNKNKTAIGEFNNIFLSDDEIAKLKALYSHKFDEAIETLSSYLESNGKKYKSHYAVLHKGNWVYKKLITDQKSSKVGGLF